MSTPQKVGRCILKVKDDFGILANLKSDEFGKYTALQWKRLIDKYTPRKDGQLIQNYEILPFAIWYKEPYAHYIYMGEKYVDPEFNVGGFYSSDYGWWSRPGVKKVPSGEKLQFKTSGTTDHWDEKAAKSGELNKLYNTLIEALISGRYD